jgi:hypothetical protein
MAATVELVDRAEARRAGMEQQDTAAAYRLQAAARLAQEGASVEMLEHAVALLEIVDDAAAKGDEATSTPTLIGCPLAGNYAQTSLLVVHRVATHGRRDLYINVVSAVTCFWTGGLALGPANGTLPVQVLDIHLLC